MRTWYWGFWLIPGILILGNDFTENRPIQSDAWENADTLDLSPTQKNSHTWRFRLGFSVLKMWQNPGGDCYGGWGVDQTDIDTSIFPSTEDLLLIPLQRRLLSIGVAACSCETLEKKGVKWSKCHVDNKTILASIIVSPPKNRFHLYNNPCPDHRELPELKKKHVFPQKIHPSESHLIHDPWKLAKSVWQPIPSMVAWYIYM